MCQFVVPTKRPQNKVAWENVSASGFARHLPSPPSPTSNGTVAKGNWSLFGTSWPS